jgi:hypothetical protein
MKWLQDNPLGMALAGVAGLLLLTALGMSILWTLPVTSDLAETDQSQTGDIAVVVAAHEVAAMSEFEVINQKPVFNESRQPVLAEIVASEDPEDTSVEIKGAPDVRLTGVIITPTMKIASLTPSDSNLESVSAHEGDALTGEFVGWHVSMVNARSVVLESRDGQNLELDLQVHDVTIKEPPKPVAIVEPAAGESEDPVNDDGEPMSRADQIRQRIAERREELRREQEEQEQGETQSGAQAGSAAKANKPPDYQSAIRAMMRNKSNEKNSDDENDG